MNLRIESEKMIDELVKQVEKILFFLRMFDSGWKSVEVESIFPPNSRGRIERVENSVRSLGTYEEILSNFADWKDLGVWNASDLITFLLTSRLTIHLANAIEHNEPNKMKDTFRFIYHFINYLLLTNIHPPSEPHRDMDPYNAMGQSFPATYDEAQRKLRQELAKSIAQGIFAKPNYKNELQELLGFDSSFTQRDLAKALETKFLKPKATPSFLIKNVGLAKELFVFLKLISLDIGFVIPTLLYQRIFKNLSDFLGGRKKIILVRTPDFLIIRGGRVMGVELGRERRFFDTRKAALITTFAGACAIPTTQINVVVGNPSINKWYDFGLKCNKCYRSFLIPECYIASELGELTKPIESPSEVDDEICNSCISGCAALANIHNYRTGRTNKKIVHYNCLSDQEKLHARPIPLYPKIEGLEILKEGLL